MPELDNNDLNTISKMADMGQPDMQLLLGKLYLKGECGLNPSKTMARKWFARAAEKNNSEAQLLLGSMYINGDGGEEKLSEGLMLVTQSAMNGNEEALNLMHSWADSGIPAIQYVLGCMYFYGKGVEANKIEARRWLLKARDQGDEDASFLLGIISAQEEDFVTAFAYVKEAANKGQADAIELLSEVQNSPDLVSENSAGNFTNRVIDTAQNRLANYVIDTFLNIFRR